MVNMCDLTPSERSSLVGDINLIMDKHYDIDRDSIIEFWDTLATGVKAREIA